MRHGSLFEPASRMAIVERSVIPPVEPEPAPYPPEPAPPSPGPSPLPSPVPDPPLPVDGQPTAPAGGAG
jgi:hypothetical protein